MNVSLSVSVSIGMSMSISYVYVWVVNHPYSLEIWCACASGQGFAFIYFSLVRVGVCCRCQIIHRSFHHHSLCCHAWSLVWICVYCPSLLVTNCIVASYLLGATSMLTHVTFLTSQRRRSAISVVVRSRSSQVRSERSSCCHTLSYHALSFITAEGIMYDLFAVCNHYGRMGFGHYTVRCFFYPSAVALSTHTMNYNVSSTCKFIPCIFRNGLLNTWSMTSMAMDTL